MPQDAAGVSRLRQRKHRAGRSTRVGTTAVLVVLYHVPRVVRAAGGGLDDLEPDAAVPRRCRCPIRTSTRSSPSRTTCRSWRWCSCWRSSPGWRRTGRSRTTAAWKQGEPPLEKLDDEKVLVWPDLVYTELICMIALTALLIFWAIWLQAPLEEPASSVKTPNPSKAPWYFLGLQEMLVYYDPWMAGVVLPSLIIVGPDGDSVHRLQQAGNGYYTIKQRRFAYIMFQFGFLELWVTLIVLGTLLRGPNWNFFGPYEHWDAHKVEALNNVNLSDIFWQRLAGHDRCRRRRRTAALVRSLGYILLRECAGHPAGARLLHRVAAADGGHGVPQVFTSRWASSVTWCWPTCCCS